ncbi:hypothetical protein BBJ29_008641 [Phytophthora kernoviae]|uniref:SAC3/GANP/THP3 conserved domain-containing protein n=1 Tax=Phytophthora kernoviae TaxID=325452 RepID=A0A3F2RDV7_9STRA|nr:hypothetical protein BBJ29_008641 [Phytophthora kernoviae]RLN54226.1 hypothetical protein BBP00_00009008 [Phytophthora kernoviae]
MYMAMLAGGQIIQKLVKKSFAPPAGEGLNAFAFNVKSRMVLRNTIKDKINAVPRDEATTQLILAESMSCFKMNNQVVRSLDGTKNHVLKFMLKWFVIIGLIIACIENKELVLALQQAARFYLVTGLRAVQLLGTLENQQDWSDKLNDEQLASALSQLLALYSMQEQAGQKGYCRVDAPELEAVGEFVTYDLLLHADDPQAVGWMLRKLSPRLRRLPPVQRALRTFVALQTDDFHRFSLEFDAMSLLERAAMLRPLPRIWTRSIKMMNKAFGKQDRFPLEELARWMLLAGINNDGKGGKQAEKLCKALNIQTQRHPPPSPPPALPTRVGGVDEAADSWETIDVVDGVAELVTKERTKPPSLGFAQFKLAPVHEKMDPELARMLVRDVAFRLEAVSATKEARSMTELVMKGAREAAS